MAFNWANRPGPALIAREHRQHALKKALADEQLENSIKIMDPDAEKPSTVLFSSQGGIHVALQR